MNIKYTILVNSTDGFDDCWFPFFSLFNKYWPEYNGIIYLNTETKDYSFPELNIICTKNNIESPQKRITWSECLIKALDLIECDIILYLQEDYFIKDFVKNEYVERYVKMMENNLEIDCIHLTDQGAINGIQSTLHPDLFVALPNQRYLVSCQAALWRKNVLLDLLKPCENAWQFEEFGSKRARKLKTQIFCLDNNWLKLNKFEIIPYIFTGIIQGRWYEPVVDLFYRENIQVDYSARGFVKDAPKRNVEKKIMQRIKRLPLLFRNWLDLNIR